MQDRRHKMFESFQQLFQSISILHIITVIIIIMIVLYYLYINRDAGNTDLLTALTPLNKKKDIATPDIVQQTILGSSGSTVMGFFLLQNGNRTSALNNNFISLMQVDNNWWLEVSHSPTTDIAARLRVQINKNGINEMEYIELPPIPKQKWMFVAILRQGRRFDVIYNNRIVASQRLRNYPVIISSPLSIGNDNLDGNVIHVIINKDRLSPDDIERQRRIYVDTNNDIIEHNYIFPLFPTWKLFAQCPSGLPCDNITKPPNDNMYSWSTPYA